MGTINGRSVVTMTDIREDQPDGRRNVVITGAKGSAAGAGITASSTTSQ